MEMFLEDLETVHGGAEAYLDRVGLSGADIDRLRLRLIADL